mmetsp:Transcript_4156/g.9265  ORF Transcript_4156/g.9265 Transcript_4156/m.9265 type:complete len:219 (+) Transcript_4156:1518-2174(+)
MQEDSRRRLYINLGVGLSTLQFVKTLKQGTTSTRNGSKARSVGNSTHKDHLGSTTPGRLLRANIDLHIASNGRNTLKIKVLLKTSQLEKVVESRAHATTKRILLEAVALREGVVTGVLLSPGDESSNGTNSEHVELVFVGCDCFLKISHADISGESTNLQHVHRSILASISRKLGTERTEDFGQLLGKVAGILNNRQESVTSHAIFGRNIRELECVAA